MVVRGPSHPRRQQNLQADAPEPIDFAAVDMERLSAPSQKLLLKCGSRFQVKDGRKLQRFDVGSPR